MKRLLVILIAVILIFSMTACQGSAQISCPPADESDMVIAPGSIGSFKPSSKEPPELKVLDSTCLGIVANIGLIPGLMITAMVPKQVCALTAPILWNGRSFWCP